VQGRRKKDKCACIIKALSQLSYRAIQADVPVDVAAGGWRGGKGLGVGQAIADLSGSLFKPAERQVALREKDSSWVLGEAASAPSTRKNPERRGQVDARRRPRAGKGATLVVGSARGEGREYRPNFACTLSAALTRSLILSLFHSFTATASPLPLGSAPSPITLHFYFPFIALSFSVSF
jgi:hypothetical protein